MEIILLEILSSISPTYIKHAKMHKLFHVPLYALSMFGSPLMEKRNKIHMQLHRVGVNLRKEIKGKNAEGHER